MGYMFDSLRALATTMRNILRKPVTAEYPKVIRPRPERYRTSFALLHDEHGEELCIGCLACERICPSQVITIKQGPKKESAVTGKKRGWAEDFTLDLTACIFCEYCVQVCPTDAIVMCTTPEVPATTREELVLTMPKLYANETAKVRAWGTGARLMEMQEVERGVVKAPTTTTSTSTSTSTATATAAAAAAAAATATAAAAAAAAATAAAAESGSANTDSAPPQIAALASGGESK